jgi:hypothetical protein
MMIKEYATLLVGRLIWIERIVRKRALMEISARIIFCLGVLVLASCDDDDHTAQLLGGGPGSSDPNNIAAGDGFCGPQDGSQALGQASFDSGQTTAKIDTDGNPLMEGHDPTWNPNTSGQVNGQPVNSAQYAYVVMSRDQMNASGVSFGDWASVTNPGNGKSVYARVEDRGPPGGTGEISQAAATAVGISYLNNSATIGNPSVIVQAYAGTAAIEGNCSAQLTSS